MTTITPDVHHLAREAVAALPDVTGLLALADRFQELDDAVRESRCRRLVRALGRDVGTPAEFDREDAMLTFSALPEDLTVLAVWLVVWKLATTRPAAVACPELQRMVRLAALAVFDMNIGLELFDAIGTPPSEGAPQAVHDLWEAAESLLLNNWYYAVHSAAHAAVGFSPRRVDDAVSRAWRLVGWAIRTAGNVKPRRRRERVAVAVC